MIEQMKSIAMNFYLTTGGLAGLFYSFMSDNWQNITLTFIMGFVAALGGGLAKLLIDKIKTNEK